MTAMVWSTSVRMWSVSGLFKEHGTTGTTMPASSDACTGHSSPMICRSVASFASTAVLGFVFVGACSSVEFVAWLCIQHQDQWRARSSSGRWWKLCNWQLQGRSLPRIGRRKMYNEACTTKSLDVYWRVVLEATCENSRTVQPNGRKARRRAHHLNEPEALIETMTKTLSTFTRIAEGPRERNVRRQPGQLLISSLLECMNLSSLEHQGDGSVLHLGEPRRFLFDQWRCGIELLVRMGVHQTVERLKQRSLELITSERRFMGLGPEHEATYDHVPADRSLGGSVLLDECHSVLSEEGLYIQWPDQATGTWACVSSRTGCRSSSSMTPWMLPARTVMQARVVEAFSTAPASDIWQYFSEILGNPPFGVLVI